MSAKKIYFIIRFYISWIQCFAFVYIENIFQQNMYDKVSLEFKKRLPTAKKLIMRPIIFLSGQKSNPKVRVYREKFNTKNFPQTFSSGFYICWDYFIQFSQHFPMKIFSPSPSLPPLSGPFFQNWQIWGKTCIKNWRKKNN